MAQIGGMEVEMLKGLIVTLFTPDKSDKRYQTALSALHTWQEDNGFTAEDVINQIRKGIKPPEIYLTFGKYGKDSSNPLTIHQIAEEDIQYLTWVYENVQRMNPATEKAIKSLLEQDGLTSISRPSGDDDDYIPPSKDKAAPKSRVEQAAQSSQFGADYDDDDIPF